MHRWMKGLIFGVVTGLVGVILGLTPLGVDFEKHVGLHWLFHVRGPIEPPPEVAVVSINERDIAGLGLPKLPRDWPRSIHADLIEHLVKLGASTIIFDMDFQRAKDREHDAVFARAVADSERVVLFERLNGKRQPIYDVQGQQTGTIWVEELVPPIPELAEAAKALAPFPVPKVQVNVYQFWPFKPSAGDAPTIPCPRPRRTGTSSPGCRGRRNRRQTRHSRSPASGSTGDDGARGRRASWCAPGRRGWGRCLGSLATGERRSRARTRT